MAKKCKYLRESNLCAARSFRMRNISLLSVKTISGGVTRNTKINPHFQCKGDLYFYVTCHATQTFDCPEYEPELPSLSECIGEKGGDDESKN